MQTIVLQKGVFGLDAVCSECGAVLLKNLPDARAAYLGTVELASHVCAKEANAQAAPAGGA